MPAIIHKIDFSAPENRPNNSSQSSVIGRKVIPLALETEPLAMYRPLDVQPCCGRHEGTATLLLALGLHFAGFAWMAGTAQQAPLIAPAPIQVAWIAAPQPKAETPPAAPPKPQPANKPKPKPKKAVKPTKPRPKTVLSTLTPTPATAPAERVEKTAPPVTKSLEAPPVSPPANAVPSASSAAPAQAPETQQPLILPNLHADYLHNPVPPYPQRARERGEQGKVLVRALINVDGTVAELAMKRSSGFPDLDRSALETVKKWRFVPARRGTVAVSAWVVVPIFFSLKG
jgi:protein TonB